MRALMLATLACLIATPAGAQNIDMNQQLLERAFTPNTPISVLFSDQVRNGCLPHPNAVKTAIELGLRRARFNVVDERVIWELQVSAIGFAEPYTNGQLSDDCAIMVITTLWYASLFRDVLKKYEPTAMNVPVMRQNSLFTSPKSGMQDLIKRRVADTIDDFANEILKATQK